MLVQILGGSHFITRGGGVRVFTPEYNFFSVRMKLQFFFFQNESTIFFYYQSVHCFIIWPNENDIMVLRAPRQHPRLPMTSGVNTITKKLKGLLLTIGIDNELITFWPKLDLRWPQDTNTTLKAWNGERERGWAGIGYIGCPPHIL